MHLLVLRSPPTVLISLCSIFTPAPTFAGNGWNNVKFFVGSRHTEWALEDHIGCLVLREQGGYMAAVTSGFVAVDLPEGGGAAICTAYAPLDQDTGANYVPALGYDEGAKVRGMNDGKDCEMQHI